MSEEIWKVIPGYDGRYWASDQGRIRGPMGKVLRPGRCRGYLIVNIHGAGTIAVHLLIARTFLKNTNEQVNHKDGDKHNNALTNLEWVTRSENQQHAVRNGLKSDAKPVVGINIRTKETLFFVSIAEAALALNGKRTRGGCISRVISGKRKSAFGHKWELA